MTDSVSAQSDLSGALLWDGLSLTKFRAPRQRRDLVPRSALLARTAALIEQHPFTLVCAPAGFGKSTLLLQLAQQLPADQQVVWLSLDGDDNDPNRLFVSLVAALRELPLRWDVEPRPPGAPGGRRGGGSPGAGGGARPCGRGGGGGGGSPTPPFPACWPRRGRVSTPGVASGR